MFGFLKRWFGSHEAKVDTLLITELGEFVEREIGPPTILHEKVSENVHVDVLWVAPSGEADYHTFVTCGMAARAMTLPEGESAGRHAELVLFLPESWPTDRLLQDPAAFWPLRILYAMARYPHLNQTYFTLGQSVPLGDLAPMTRFNSTLLVPALLLDTDPKELKLTDGRTVEFFCVAPLFPEELTFKMAVGIDEFWSRLVQRGRIEDLIVVNPERPSILLSRVVVLEGDLIHDEQSFYDQVQRKLCPDFDGFGRNLDAFNDILYGGAGWHEFGEILSIQWSNSDASRLALGDRFFDTALKIIHENGIHVELL